MPKLQENNYLRLADGSKPEAKTESGIVLNLRGIATWRLQATALDNPIFDILLGGMKIAKTKAKIDYKNNGSNYLEKI